MTDQGSVRNLELIQETEAGPHIPRIVSITMLALGAGCIVFAAMALGDKKNASVPAKVDPLGDLVAQSKPVAAAAKPTELSAKEVTFPSILSDEPSPPTALAAVKGNPVSKPADALGQGAALAEARSVPGRVTAPIVSGGAHVSGFAHEPTAGEAVPPPATDRLSVVPLPAQAVLDATPVVTRPRDALTKAATEVAHQSTAAQAPAPAGKDGGYQLQISSFRSSSEADQFASQLRARGHKAHVVEARVPSRGTWYRVRIGPFPSQHAAAAYRSGFEGREHVVPFVVPPQGK